MRYLYAATLILAVAALAAAGPRSRRVKPGQTHYDSYAAGAHADRRIDARIVADVLQINPGYSSFYAPDGYDAATQQDILNELRRQGFRLDQVAGLVQAQKATVVPNAAGQPAAVVVPVAPAPAVPSPRPAAAPANPAAGLAVLVAKCAACHQEGKLAPDQRFTLLDAKGALVSLTDRQKMAVLKRTYRGEMPPQPNKLGVPSLADQDYAAIEALVQGN